MIQPGRVSQCSVCRLTVVGLQQQLCVEQVGPRMLFSWFGHYAALTAYAFMARIGPLLRRVPRLGQSWWLARMQEAWTYGAGLDWKGPQQHQQGAHEEPEQPAQYPPAALQTG